MKQIAENFYLLTYPFGVNMYLIKDTDGLTLIDTSVPPAAKWVLKLLETQGYTPGDLKRILITHAHPDHYGGLHELKAATNAQVYASAQEREVLEGRIDVPRRAKKPRMPVTWAKPATTVDCVIGEGDVLPEVLGGMQVLFTPGHAPGHLTFWHPEHKIAVAGDVLFNVFGLTLPPGPLTVNMEDDRRSVGRLAGLGVEILCVGHGSPIVEGTGAKLLALAHKKGIPVQEPAEAVPA